MARRKSEKGKGPSGTVPTGLFRRMSKYLGRILLILLGGLIFNLDRLGDFSTTLLRHRELVPYRLRGFLPGGSAPAGLAQKNEVLKGRVTEVYDGDTITLLAGEKNYRIRFYGIDAPEAKQQDGIPSRDALREKILGYDVTVTVKNVDHYGRAVGKVSREGRDINLEMVREGHAWYYANYAKGERDLEDAQRIARENRLGLWHAEAPVPPWQYRAAGKKPVKEEKK